jgi:hypothetical protein
MTTARGLFVVRAEVPDAAERPAFDRWYATEHLPDAVAAFGALRGWRCWSRSNPAVHYAFYEFAELAQAEAVPASPEMPRLVAEFDRAWGKRVTRTREVLEVARTAP